MISNLFYGLFHVFHIISIKLLAPDLKMTFDIPFRHILSTIE